MQLKVTVNAPEECKAGSDISYSVVQLYILILILRLRCKFAFLQIQLIFHFPSAMFEGRRGRGVKSRTYAMLVRP